MGWLHLKEMFPLLLLCSCWWSTQKWLAVNSEMNAAINIFTLISTCFVPHNIIDVWIQYLWMFWHSAWTFVVWSCWSVCERWLQVCWVQPAYRLISVGVDWMQDNWILLGQATFSFCSKVLVPAIHWQMLGCCVHQLPLFHWEHDVKLKGFYWFLLRQISIRSMRKAGFYYKQK